MKKNLRKLFLIAAGAAGLSLVAPAAFAQTVHVDEDFSNLNGPNLNDFWEAPEKPSNSTIANTYPEHWDFRDQDPEGTANRSLWTNGGNLRRFRAENWTQLEVAPSNSEPVVLSFRFYDFMDAAKAGEDAGLAYVDLRAFSPTILFAFGVNGSTTKYAVRQYPTHGWVELDTDRSEGWHEVKFVIRRDSFDLYVDGQLDPKATSLSFSGSPVFTQLDVGGSFSGDTETFLYDDVYLANDPAYAPAVEIVQQPTEGFHARGDVKGFGESATFSVIADGSALPLTYQWLHDGEPLSNDARISGADTTEVTIANLDGSDSGFYSVEVTDANGNSVTSNAIHLTAMMEHEVIMNVMDLPTEAFVGTWGTYSQTAGWFGWMAANTVNELDANGDPNPEATATFQPTITQTGWYDVYTWFVPSYSGPGENRTNEAPYTVQHAGGEDLVIINQQHPNGPTAETWVHVGTFEFQEGTDGTVVISNHRKGPSGDDAFGSLVLADAVRFIPGEAPAVDVLLPNVAISRGAGNAIELVITGEPNASHVVQVSDDLVTWTDLGDPVTLDSNGAGKKTDPDATASSRRFYRVKE